MPRLNPLPYRGTLGHYIFGAMPRGGVLIPFLTGALSDTLAILKRLDQWRLNPLPYRGTLGPGKISN